jgi:hypothetical protein
MQSITWEAVWGLFTDVFKRGAKGKNVADIEAIWDKYAKGLSYEKTIEQVIERGGGINAPEWHTDGSDSADAGGELDSSYKE